MRKTNYITLNEVTSNVGRIYFRVGQDGAFRCCVPNPEKIKEVADHTGDGKSGRITVVDQDLTEHSVEFRGGIFQDVIGNPTLFPRENSYGYVYLDDVLDHPNLYMCIPCDDRRLFKIKHPFNLLVLDKISNMFHCPEEILEMKRNVIAEHLCFVDNVPGFMFEDQNGVEEFVQVHPLCSKYNLGDRFLYADLRKHSDWAFIDKRGRSTLEYVTFRAQNGSE